MNKTYNEKSNKLSEDARAKIIEALAKSEYGQAIREELVDSIEQLSSVRTISKEVFEGDPQRLAIETIAKDLGAGYLEGLYKLLIPKEKKEVGFKTHK